MQGMGATGLPHGPANASTRLSVAESSGPQTLGDFDVIKTLGTGSFGKVKRECPFPPLAPALARFLSSGCRVEHR